MENVISGLLLKLEDKIRVGEVITRPGDAKKAGKGRIKTKIIDL